METELNYQILSIMAFALESSFTLKVKNPAYNPNRGWFNNLGNPEFFDKVVVGVKLYITTYQNDNYIFEQSEIQNELWRAIMELDEYFRK